MVSTSRKVKFLLSASEVMVVCLAYLLKMKLGNLTYIKKVLIECSVKRKTINWQLTYLPFKPTHCYPPPQKAVVANFFETVTKICYPQKKRTQF